MDGLIIITRTNVLENSQSKDTLDSWRYTPHTQIVQLDPDKPDRSLKVLTANFYSARSPKISYDGKYLLFAGQQKQTDPWEIWEMNLKDLKDRQVTSSKENCTDPDYLPGGRLVFSKFTDYDTLKAGHSLYVCNLDGSNLKRITFNPHTYFASKVLNDGRVLTLDRQIFPEKGDPMFIVLRPDGTKAELFYNGNDSSAITSAGSETIDSRIIFIESGKSNSKAKDLISISYNRPLRSRINLTSEIEGDFNSVCSQKSGRLLVTYRKSQSDRYALYEFDPENKTLGKALYNNTDFDVLEAIEAGKHERPKKLPSEVDMGVKTGLLMCQDVNVSDRQNSGRSSSIPKSSRIEIVGLDSTLGSVDVEADGSFYLKVMADKPFRIQTIDKDGNVIHSACGWIWIRPNERRGCIGCHEDHEMVPGNKVPLAVKKSPVIVPVHINKVVEKKVSLE